MTVDEIVEFLAWDAQRPGNVATSEWPGFAKIWARDSIVPVHRLPQPSSRRRPLPFRAVWDRDDWTCQHCGRHQNLTVDHIIARVNGGSDDLDNLQTLCGSCNSRKGAR